MIVAQIAFRDLEWSAQTIRDAIAGTTGAHAPDAPLDGITRLVVVFALSIVVNAAVSSNLVAALIDRGLAPTFAATVGGALGIMQLPGRILLSMRARLPIPCRC